MAHYAELDETNTVLRVLVVHNDVTTIDGVEDEQNGIDFLNDLLPDSGTWVQTSFNRNFRGRYAMVEGTYDAASDVFIARQPFPSWTLNGDNEWEPPVAYPGVPTEAPYYRWDEDTTSWIEVE